MRFDVRFNQTSQNIPVLFQTNISGFNVAFDAFQIAQLRPEVEYYEGVYDVTPLITSQVLPTNQKFMNDDVRIDMIPTREIDNAAGGVTFIVGG